MPRKRNPGGRRRATILLMVVSLLALLFVIVTGYLSLSLYERQTFQRVQRGNVVDRALDSIERLVLSKIGQSLKGSAGTLGGDPKVIVESIPGAPSHGWLASPEPIRDMAVLPSAYNNPSDPNYFSTLPALTSTLPHWLDSYRYVSTSWLDGYSEIPRFVRQLMLEYPTDLNAMFEDVPGSNNPTQQDITRNTLMCFGDADADGFPDTFLPGVARAVDIANEVAGTPVRTPRKERDLLNPNNLSPFQTSAIPGAGTNGRLQELWRAYEELRRFDVAIRVIPHGGMVTLAAPTSAKWNREFVAGMFNHLRRDGQKLGAGANWDDFFDEISNASSAIEGTLRRRGGLLPAYYDSTSQNMQGDRRLPPILRYLEKTWPATFDFSVPVGGDTPAFPSWQRFNLAESNNLGFWRYFRAVWADPKGYNLSVPPADPNSIVHYDRRRWLTTVNNSDDVARKQGADFDPGGALLTTRRGDAKFYLGDLQAAFNPTTGAFLGGPGQAGRRVLIELKKYFTDMLSGHNFAASKSPSDPNQPMTDPNVQAWMLAVNTLQFAAPRRTDGQIDQVYYDDNGSDGAAFPGVFPAGYVPTQRRYAGYAPQPFITQLIAFNGEDDPNEPEKIALLVELYNPNDRDPQFKGTPGDRFALRLDQFAITVNDPNPNLNPTALRILQTNGVNVNLVVPPGAAPDRLPGREFLSFAVHNNDNVFFETPPLMPTNGQGVGYINDVNVQRVSGTPDKITVRLWRRGLVGVPNPVWYQVDVQELSLQGAPNNAQWWAYTHRDTTADHYFGNDDPANPALGRAARWRMAVAFDTNDGSNYKYNVVTSQPGPLGIQFIRETVNQPGPTAGGAAAPTPGVGDSPWTPAVPMPLMNAGATPDLTIHGVKRPRSFPTVGFMLFVPRFAHTEALPGAPAGVNGPLTVWTRAQYNNLASSQQNAAYANLGHMPILDNKQPAKPKTDSYFAKENAGQLPWGLLVFDYFTTHDPNVADPTKIPGRIDINSAPWYVLAGLPVIGPNPPSYNAPLVAASAGFAPAAPAFWSPTTGILFGTNCDPALVQLPSNAPPPPTYTQGGDGPVRARFIGSDPGAFGQFGYRGRFPNQPNGGLVHWDAAPLADSKVGWYRLGPWLAQAAAAYRDRVQIFSSADASQQPWGAYVYSHARNDLSNSDPDLGEYRDESRYGEIRRAKSTPTDKHRGFVSLGELLNVAGFDGTTATDMQFAMSNGLSPSALTSVEQGDFIKSVSLMALLDTHFLTTRSNTYTVYVSIMDRENPQSSVRSQLTVDRSNLLPGVVQTAAPTGKFVTTDGEGLPDVITSKRIGYYNARYDD